MVNCEIKEDRVRKPSSFKCQAQKVKVDPILPTRLPLILLDNVIGGPGPLSLKRSIPYHSKPCEDLDQTLKCTKLIASSTNTAPAGEAVQTRRDQ